MRCSDVGRVLILVLWAAPAAAECFICDEVVELNDDYAACFIENFDLVLEAFVSSPGGRQTVNLAGCEADGGARRRGGLLEMGGLTTEMAPLPPETSEAGQIKSVYILDRPLALCLRDLIDAHEGPFDPSVAFDLVEACNGG